MRAVNKLRFKKNLKVVVLTLICVVSLTKIAVLFTEEQKLYLPEKNVTLTPRDLKISYEDIYFKTSDGQKLNGWFIPADHSRLTILYCKGRGGNLTDGLPQVKFFKRMGVNLFMFDYRGYGNSSGSPSEGGLYRDAEAAYDVLAGRKDVDKDRIIVYGKSLGGAVASHLCLFRKAAALVLEGSFPSLRTYVGDIGGLLPLQWLVSEKFDTLSNVRKIKIPKLIVHGMDDEIIVFSEGRLIFNQAAEPKRFLAFDGAHDDSLFVISKEYQRELEQFFEESHFLEPSRTPGHAV